jgi:hypothetical protein
MQGGCQGAAGAQLRRGPNDIAAKFLKVPAKTGNDVAPSGVACVLQIPRTAATSYSMTASLSRYQQTRCYRFGWAFERVGWLAMGVVVLAAVAGAFGGGWLSFQAATGGDSLVARYPRLGRAHSPLELHVTWPASQSEATLWIERAYLDDFAIEEVRPPPSSVTLHPQRIYYSFRVSNAGERVAIELRVRAKRGGRFVGSIGFEDEAAVAIRQFMFP